MNKRALTGLLVVPLVLMGAMIWVRQRQWREIEGRCRREILSNMGLKRPQNTTAVLEVIPTIDASESSQKLGSINAAQMGEILNDVSLEMGSKKDADLQREHIIVCYVERSVNLGAVGFKLDLERDEGSILEMVSGQTQYTSPWSHLQLTPESCRALKKQIWRDFGPKLRALHIPPPR